MAGKKQQQMYYLCTFCEDVPEDVEVYQVKNGGDQGRLRLTATCHGMRHIMVLHYALYNPSQSVTVEFFGEQPPREDCN